MREYQRRAPRARPGRPGVLGSLLLGTFLAGSLVFGYLFYASVRDIVAYASLPFLIGGSPLQEEGGGPAGTGPISQRKLTERVNVLLLGIDQRKDDPDPCRTDTMMLLSLDPATNTATMLSLPRDLWVSIPVLKIEERINAAHAYGDLYAFPGGGPALAKRTVQYNLGIPVHYYVRIDFGGFTRAIDAIGGIDVDVPQDIVDNAYPTPDYGTMRLVIRAGRQHMDGDLALKYARTRHTGAGDFDRARRQQQVIMAARDKVLSLNFPIARIPEQLRALGDSVQTDMSLEELLTVAQAARQVPPENIRTSLIDESMTIPWVTPKGWDVLVPRREKIRLLVGELFPMPTPTVSLGPLGDRERLGQEAARVEVQNGTQTAGLASRTAAELRSLGYNVVAVNNADRSDYAETIIIGFAEEQYTLASLRAYLKVPEERIYHRDVPSSVGVDIRIIVGQDALQR